MSKPGSDSKKKWLRDNTKKFASTIKPHEALFDITTCAIGLPRALQCLNSSQIDWNHPYAVVYSTTDRCYWLLCDSDRDPSTMVEDFKSYASEYAMQSRGLSSSRKTSSKSSLSARSMEREGGAATPTGGPLISGTAAGRAQSSSVIITSKASVGEEARTVTPTSHLQTSGTTGLSSHTHTAYRGSAYLSAERSPHKASPFRSSVVVGSAGTTVGSSSSVPRGASPNIQGGYSGKPVLRRSSLGRKKGQLITQSQTVGVGQGSNGIQSNTTIRTHSPNTPVSSALSKRTIHTHSTRTPPSSKPGVFTPIASIKTHAASTGRGTPRSHVLVSSGATIVTNNVDRTTTPVPATVLQRAVSPSSDMEPYVTPRRNTQSPVKMLTPAGSSRLASSPIPITMSRRTGSSSKRSTASTTSASSTGTSAYRSSSERDKDTLSTSTGVKQQLQGFTYVCLGSKLEPYSPEYNISHCASSIHKAIEFLSSHETDWDKPYAILLNRRDNQYYLIARPHFSCTPCLVLCWKSERLCTSCGHAFIGNCWMDLQTVREEQQSPRAEEVGWNSSGLLCVTYNVGCGRRNKHSGSHNGDNDGVDNNVHNHLNENLDVVRIPYILSLLQMHKPDVISLQEVNAHCLQLILACGWVQSHYAITHITVSPQNPCSTTVMLYNRTRLMCTSDIIQYNLPSWQNNTALLLRLAPKSQGSDSNANSPIRLPTSNHISTSPTPSSPTPTHTPDSKDLCLVSFQLESGTDHGTARVHQCGLLFDQITQTHRNSDVLLMGDFNSPYPQEIRSMHSVFTGYKNCWESLLGTTPATHVNGHQYHHALIRSKNWEPSAAKLLGTSQFYTPSGMPIHPSPHFGVAVRFLPT